MESIIELVSVRRLAANRRNFEAGQLAAVSHSAVVAFAATVLVGQHFFSFELRNHLGFDRRLGSVFPDFDRIPIRDEKHIRESGCGTLFLVDFLNFNQI